MGNTIALAEKRALAERRNALQAQARGAEYLNSATVVAASRAHVEVKLVDGRRAEAKLALAMPYQPVVGDELLVIGNKSGFWVIGVVSGRGHLDLRMDGDIDIHAVGGRLRLGGDEGVDVVGRTIAMRSKELKVAASSLVERFTTAVRSVREMLAVRAGERQLVVEGTSLEKAKRMNILGEENVAINGQQVHLG